MLAEHPPCTSMVGGHKDDKDIVFDPKTPEDTASNKKTFTGRLLSGRQPWLPSNPGSLWIIGVVAGMLCIYVCLLPSPRVRQQAPERSWNLCVLPLQKRQLWSPDSGTDAGTDAGTD